MASLNLGAASLKDESWVVFGSTLKVRIGFRNKRFSEKWRFRVQQMSGMEQMTKQELARSAKRSESLRQILKQYGISSVESRPEKDKTSSRLDDLNCQEKHDDDSETNTTEEELRSPVKHGEIVSITQDHDAVPSVSKMNTTEEELPDLGRRQEEVSGQNHHRFPHLKTTGALFTSSLLPLLGICMFCIIAIISSKTSRGHHEDGSKRKKRRTALCEKNETVASDDEPPDTSLVSSATNEVDEACSKVEREYKRFLLECGLSES